MNVQDYISADPEVCHGNHASQLLENDRFVLFPAA
jgi:hypothetical protein